MTRSVALRAWLSAVVVVSLFGCGGATPPGSTEQDADHDGVTAAAGDCNDGNADVHPGATETCNGVDDDCDGDVDEDLKGLFFVDADGDGFGSSADPTFACTAPAGTVSNFNDCDDSDANIHPGAAEVCDGVDNDCDGTTDDGVGTTFFADVDNDGFGNAASTIVACSPPAGYVSDATDCNDAAATIHPGATESCNDVDDDCDGQVDEGTKLTFYADADNDGEGNAAVTQEACSAPTGYVAVSGDCDDAAASVHTGATETCNGTDDNCDGAVDEGVKTTFYADADSDGEGNLSVTQAACTAPNGYVTNASDCDDANPAIRTSATETCNDTDDDCDGQVDEGVTSVFGRDSDQDGYGDPANTTMACSVPQGYVANTTDCNDAAAKVHPGALEPVNGVDEDCSGTPDDVSYAGDCLSILMANPGAPNGHYKINPDAAAAGAFEVYCDMTTRAGGWTVIQRRVSAAVDFYRSYAEYTAGFGSLDGNFWLGNEKIRRLTQNRSVGLMVAMRPKDPPPGDYDRLIAYDTFSVGAAASGYVLTVAGPTDYNGVGDSLTYHSGKAFSTYDGGPASSCSTSFKAGWWYGGCMTANPNGIYYVGGSHATYGDGIDWQSFRGYYEGMIFFEMKVRSQPTRIAPF